MNNHLSEEEMVLHYYGESEGADAIDAHLSECPQCRESFLQLRDLLENQIPTGTPDPGPNYGRRLWQQLEPQLDASTGSGFTVVPFLRRWAIPLSAAALFLLVFLLGRYGPEPPDPVTYISEQASTRLFAVNVGQHLEKTQFMVQDLSNVAQEEEGYFLEQRALAAELLADNRIYRNLAKTRGETELEAMLSEVEFLLLNLANSNEEDFTDTLADDREAIEEMLFQIRVIRARLGKSLSLSKTPDPDALTI